jgi:hypothetical protein
MSVRLMRADAYGLINQTFVCCKVSKDLCKKCGGDN